MAVAHLTDDDFDKTVATGKPMVVDFWAPWCGPCRMIAPIYEEIEKTLGDKVNFGKINVDDHQRTASKFGVTSIPTLIFFKDGQRIDTMVGAVPKPMLEQKIKSVFSL